MARKKPPAPPAWMDTKISATIIDFGMPLIEQLPADAPLEIRQGMVSFIVQVWNAHVMAMPLWGQPQHVGEMRKTLMRAGADQGLAQEALATFEMLSARRRERRFANDPRAVGEWSVRVIDAENWNIRCDARLPLGMTSATPIEPPPA
jgi:hypothetical protein